MKILKSVWTIFRTRPLHIPTLVRSKFLFWMVFIVRKLGLVHYPGIHFGKNIRLQSFFSLKSEIPYGQISIGDDCIIYENACIETYGHGQIHLGVQSILGDVRIYSRKKINIGDRVLIAWNVLIQDYNPHPTTVSARRAQVQKMVEEFYPNFSDHKLKASKLDRNLSHLNDSQSQFDFESEEICIASDVWLGANSVILKGVQIGEGAIVAAGAVVFKGTYPAKSLLMGNPAQIVKILDE
jgi:acetyltransferase-like isoleucine patch superfamily enzyme